MSEIKSSKIDLKNFNVGGFIKEYQVDVQPEALKAYDVSVMDVMNAVKKSNLDIGGQPIP